MSESGYDEDDDCMAYIDAQADLTVLREALELIVGDRECDVYTRFPYCRSPGSHRYRDATYQGDRWCGVCIARDALERAT